MDNNGDMNITPRPECCICGNVPLYVNRDELQYGVTVCAGFCSTGLDVDLTD